MNMIHRPAILEEAEVAYELLKSTHLCVREAR